MAVPRRPLMKPGNKSLRQSLIHFLPQDAAALNILRARADRIAQQAITLAQKTSVENYVCFRLGLQEYYGLPYRYAQEVMHHLSLTPLPHAPAFIRGVINRRGSL